MLFIYFTCSSFQMLVSRLLEYQGRVERLIEQSRRIHPIHWRKHLPDCLIKARALIDYNHKEVTLDLHAFGNIIYSMFSTLI